MMIKSALFFWMPKIWLKMKPPASPISSSVKGPAFPFAPSSPGKNSNASMPRQIKLKPADIGLWDLMKGVFHDSWVADLIMINRKGAAMKREQLIYLILASTVPLAALLIAIKMIRG